MAEDGGKTNPTETKEGGNAGCKCADIMATPTSGTTKAVIPYGKQPKEQE
jgi:hypothetical protein